MERFGGGGGGGDTLQLDSNSSATGPKTYQGDQEVCTKSHGNH
ncbi:hypothetical protein HanXRQr2_Chr03g0127091 [Helianthus annuus]|uniref:Uncharacterized protein n=1 Tax=Helianthus annuus TaxID=4232 RepID=A0A9K3NXL6_HELAN|nr:hypothetical protein HanXRQr2_Chr03g0127091 [Helianthus annuus]